jgi:hypothetical protein
VARGVSDLIPVLRIVNTDGSYGDSLPGWNDLQIGGDDGEQLVLSLSYNSNAPGYTQLTHGTQLAVLLGGAEVSDGRFVLDQTETDEVEQTGLGKFTGNSTLFTLNYAIVYAESWNTGSGGNVSTPGWGFSNQTPGQALRELLEAAQARGWWTGLTWDFNDTLDSSGVAWTAQVSDFFEQGKTLLDVLKVWKQRQVCVARMNGSVLRLFQYGRQGPDLTQDVILLREVDLYEGPVNKSTRDSISVLYAVTDTFGVEVTNAPAMSEFGRREGFLSQVGVADTGTLTSIAQGTMALKARSRDSYTYGLMCAPGRPKPMVDYDRGAQVQLDVIGVRRVMRVRQLTVKWTSDGQMDGSAAFGDRVMDADEQLAMRIEQLTRGSMDGGVYGQPILGEFNPPPGGGGSTPDSLIPKAPTGLSATSAPYFEPPGSQYATVTLTWVAPTQNIDNSALLDLGAFEVQFKPTTGTVWVFVGRYEATATSAGMQRMVPGVSYDFRVRAVDVWSNVSAWSSVYTYTPGSDSSAPTTTPSTPTVAPFLFQGLLITWNGKNSTGGSVDNDTRHVEVHVSTTNNFTPDATTLKDTIPVPGGSTVVSGLTAGTTYRVKFRLIDWAGNVGNVSAQATGVPESVDSTDIGAGAVGTTQLASLAVTDAKVADLSATKITAGTISAVVTVSGTFRTASTGQRVVFDSSGVKLYDSSNNIVVDLNASTGAGTFNGVLGTANISGSIYVDGSAGSRVTVTNLSGIPLMAFQTGKLIEKYPSYHFASTNSFLRQLMAQIHAPGTSVFGMPSTSFVTTQFQLNTIMQDGDFDNATSLASVVHGTGKFVFPQFNNGSNIFTNAPQLTVASHIRGAPASPSNPMTEPGRRPGLTLWNSANTQQGITMHLEPTGAGANQCILAARELDGTGAYAGYRASTFDNVSARATKENFAAVPFEAMDVILANAVMKWNFIGREDEEFIGPMADDLPAELISRGGTEKEISMKMGSIQGLLWKALQEVDERLVALEGGGRRG